MPFIDLNPSPISSSTPVPNSGSSGGLGAPVSGTTSATATTASSTLSLTNNTSITPVSTSSNTVNPSLSSVFASDLAVTPTSADSGIKEVVGPAFDPDPTPPSTGQVADLSANLDSKLAQVESQLGSLMDDVASTTTNSVNVGNNLASSTIPTTTPWQVDNKLASETNTPAPDGVNQLPKSIPVSEPNSIPTPNPVISPVMDTAAEEELQIGVASSGIATAADVQSTANSVEVLTPVATSSELAEETMSTPVEVDVAQPNPIAPVITDIWGDPIDKSNSEVSNENQNQVEVMAMPSLSTSTVTPVVETVNAITPEVSSVAVDNTAVAVSSQQDDAVEEPKPTQPKSDLAVENLATPDKTVMQGLSEVSLQTHRSKLDDILADALVQKASDVHLNAGYRAMARIDGNLVPLKSEILTSEAIHDLIKPVMVGRDNLDLDKPTDIDLAYSLPDSSARFRVNVYRERKNHAAVFRLIPETIRSIEQLGLPKSLRQFANLEQGLILVTGATGNGKSTTIAAIINEINQTQSKHIVTIEDPIEYVYPPAKAVVSQRTVEEDTETWSGALRSVLRQDPNIVVIGEMRDLETIAAAMTVAETGHLVFATLHTNSASQSIDRIIDVFPEFQQNQIRTQLASTLTAVISQRLVPLKAGGRKAVIEIMIASQGIKAAIREGKVYQIDNMIQTSADEGMVSLEKSLAELVRKGLVDPEVAIAYANKPNDLMTLLR